MGDESVPQRLKPQIGVSSDGTAKAVPLSKTDRSTSETDRSTGLTCGLDVSRLRIRPYILAGGQSSRMGRDKAALSLGGLTLLRRAVETLRAVPALMDTSGRVTVTIVGERTELDGADRVIADRYPMCGPLGGMEAALGDLERSGDMGWAFFMPVDMPFLSSRAIDGLLREWIAASADGARVCHVVVDGRPQPLVSMMHRAVRPFMVEALTAGEFKVTPVLQSAGEALALPCADRIGSGLHKSQGGQDALASAGAGWTATGEQEQLKRLWFSNLNTEQEFRDAETFIASLGSTR